MVLTFEIGKNKYVYKYSLLSYVCLFNDNRTFLKNGMNVANNWNKSGAELYSVAQLLQRFWLKEKNSIF